ncbi:hypothetical protein KR222_010963, partial [Zaprionus bogoriensis]
FKIQLGLTILTYVTATMKMTDYSTANYVPVTDGDVTIWNEYGYLGHTTNISAYEAYLRETKEQIGPF